MSVTCVSRFADWYCGDDADRWISLSVPQLGLRLLRLRSAQHRRLIALLFFVLPLPPVDNI